MVLPVRFSAGRQRLGRRNTARRRYRCERILSLSAQLAARQTAKLPAANISGELKWRNKIALVETEIRHEWQLSVK